MKRPPSRSTWLDKTEWLGGRVTAGNSPARAGDSPGAASSQPPHMSVSQSIGRTTSFLVYGRPYPRIRTATTDLGRIRTLEPAHALGSDWFVLALDGQLLERSGRFVQKLSEALRHHDLAATGEGLQPRRGVHDIADGREVTDCGFPADVADERFAVLEAYAEVEHGTVWAAVAEAFEQQARMVQHHLRHRPAILVLRPPRGSG